LQAYLESTDGPFQLGYDISGFTGGLDIESNNYPVSGTNCR
jgi:hypothetical protein